MVVRWGYCFQVSFLLKTNKVYSFTLTEPLRIDKFLWKQIMFYPMRAFTRRSILTSDFFFNPFLEWSEIMLNIKLSIMYDLNCTYIRNTKVCENGWIFITLSRKKIDNSLTPRGRSRGYTPVVTIQIGNTFYQYIRSWFSFWFLVAISFFATSLTGPRFLFFDF